jgi:hypothetical protein
MVCGGHEYLIYMRSHVDNTHTCMIWNVVILNRS